MKQITVLGIDLAKNVFELCGMDSDGAIILRKRIKRGRFFEQVLQSGAEVICMEACGSAHYWARRLQGQGQAVRLLPPHRVKAFGKGNKNDRNDAEAIALAGNQPSIRPVAIKTVEQQDIQALHRMRELTKGQTNQVINQLRGLLAEYGIHIAQSKAAFRRSIPDILEDADNELSGLLRERVAQLWQRFQALEEERQQFDRDLQAIHRASEACRRMGEVEGIGPQTATAYYATIGDPHQFRRGREVSAWLGLVPRQHASGEHHYQMGISKRGNGYLRMLLIHGARSMVQRADTMKGPRGRWLRRRIALNGPNKAAVALANKNARLLWALMAHDDHYRVFEQAQQGA